MLLRSFFRSSLLMLSGPAVLAGLLVCTTSVEAPPLDSGFASVEVTVCHPMETTSELINRRSYSWGSPMLPGVDSLHQWTDALGIAVGGPRGNRIDAGRSHGGSLPRRDSPVVTLSLRGSSNLVNAANS